MRKTSFSKGSMNLKAESKQRTSHLTCSLYIFTLDSIFIKTWLSGWKPAQIKKVMIAWEETKKTIKRKV